MVWFRVDNRLVHGQIIEGWLPYLDAHTLFVVNDALSQNKLQQQIMQLAIPGRVKVVFTSVKEAHKQYAILQGKAAQVLFLVQTCEDALRLAEEGIPMPVLNIGNLHYSEGKKQVCAHAALSAEDMRCLNSLRDRGTRLDFRSVPGDTPQMEDW